jgi:hypothetical protein
MRSSHVRLCCVDIAGRLPRLTVVSAVIAQTRALFDTKKAEMEVDARKRAEFEAQQLRGKVRSRQHDCCGERCIVYVCRRHPCCCAGCIVMTLRCTC